MPLRRLLVLSLVGFAAAGTACGGDERAGPGGAAPVSTTPPGVPEECEAALPAQTGPAVPGLLRVEGAVLGVSGPRGNTTQVVGFVPLDPDAFLAMVKRRGKWKVLFEEQEAGFETELIISDGRHRNFWKVVRACPSGSRFTAVVGDEPRPSR